MNEKQGRRPKRPPRPQPRTGSQADGSYVVGVYCATCMRRFGATTLLAVLGGYSWARVTRTKHKNLKKFKRRADAKDPTGGAELYCQRCGARPRVNLDRLDADADAVRRAGGSAISI